MKKNKSEDFITLILQDSEVILKRSELKNFCKSNSIEITDVNDKIHIKGKRLKV